MTFLNAKVFLLERRGFTSFQVFSASRILFAFVLWKRVFVERILEICFSEGFFNCEISSTACQHLWALLLGVRRQNINSWNFCFSLKDLNCSRRDFICWDFDIFMF